ncbi:MAG: queuosine salvage family protein [Caldilineales bacterium]|nr:queuosine salvage family protein [Caldilineales bacterium]MDW8317268.1 queuosine salvage family protein [Anaerolineae bacterium]
MLIVNEAQCQAIAQRLRQQTIRADEYLFVPATREEARREANYWTFVVAICQHTKSLAGTIDGRWCRGWDYLVRATRRVVDEVASAEAMAAINADRLRAILSDDFDPAHSTVDRVEERLRQLHEVAATLLEQYEGEAMNLYHQAGGRIAGPDGIIARLRAIPAFQDPLNKKAQLLVGHLDAAGVWPLDDPENLKVCMDYHAMRVALRTGIVEITDPGLRIALKQKAPVTDEINHRVRQVVSDACDRVIALSGVSVYEFDKWIWHLGRSCCFYDHEPICGPRTCHKMDICTYIKAVDYRCLGKCSLDGACKGSRDDDYRALWETNVYTEYY